MGVFKIEGGHQLKGSIKPQGAKNEALQIFLRKNEKERVKSLSDLAQQDFVYNL